MIEQLSQLPLPLQGLLGSLVAGLCSGVGAVPILFRRAWSQKAQVLMLAIAAGVMLGASVFSLIVPALDLWEARDVGGSMAAVYVASAIVLGAVAVWGIHALVPHAHFVRGPDGAPTIDLGRNWLFILAITLHNFPEGMSVGVSYGGGIPTGLAVTIGIGLQNLPEGLAVAAALVGDGFESRRAFVVALLTGLIEPIGGVFGATAVSFSDTLLPWGLAFAGGAMLFVISGEIIPETHRRGVERPATLALVVGFVVMMVLDVALA